MDHKQVVRRGTVHVCVCVCALGSVRVGEMRQALQTVLPFSLPCVIYKQDLFLKIPTNHFGKWVPTKYLPVD